MSAVEPATPRDERLVPRTTRERKIRRHSERIPTVLYVDAEYGLVRDRQDMVGNDLTTVMRWCSTHDEVVWLYNDGSYTCPQEQVIEYDDGTHVVVRPPFTVSAEVGYRISRAPDEETVALAERLREWADNMHLNLSHVERDDLRAAAALIDGSDQ